MATRRPRLATDNASIARKLRTDSEALARAETWVRKRIYGLQDEEARWLYEQYVTAYRAMSAALEGAYTLDGDPDLIKRVAMLDQIEREMLALTGQVYQHITNAMVEAYQQGFYGRGWVLDSATNEQVRIRVPILPTEAVRSLLLNEYLGVQWGETLAFERTEFITRIKRSLTQSMIQGEGIMQARERLLKELGIKPSMRKEFKRSMYRTLLITRTELMRASNLGALAIYEQNQDVLKGWEWVATLDERTCPICGRLDGSVYEFGSPQAAPPSGSHPGCRCTIVPVLINTDLMNAMGIRQNYESWARDRGLWNDGGLATQRAADAHGLNTTSGQ